MKTQMIVKMIILAILNFNKQIKKYKLLIKMQFQTGKKMQKNNKISNQKQKKMKKY